jgi:hypothetical protein
LFLVELCFINLPPGIGEAFDSLAILSAILAAILLDSNIPKVD